MAVRVGINGFGRIGRLVFRAGWENGLDVVAVNDITDAATLAHLLTYDSVHRTWATPVAARGGDLDVGGRTVRVLSVADPAKLPWKDLGVGVVIESTGRYTDRDKAAAHLAAGARKVIVSAPGRNADVTIVPGVNDAAYDSAAHHVVSAASCTTNCLAPVAKVLDDTFGIERGTMTTVHAYTNDQRILDSPHKDLRRARGAGQSIIPTSTGAARAIGLVVPSLAGKLDGFALRVPVPDGSVVDLVVSVREKTTREDVNAALQRAASAPPLQGYLRYTELPLVSSDIVGDPHSSIVDGLSTIVVDGTLVKVVAWYDNEWGYANRVVGLARTL